MPVHCPKPTTSASLANGIPEPTFQRSTLANGLTVVTFPMPWLHEAGATLLVKAGSRYESDAESGIAHFLEHMVFKGIDSIPDPTEFHTRLEAMAADMNASTGHETNAYWLSLPPEALEEGFTLFCRMFTHPALSGIETERQVVLEEMREDENEKGEIVNPDMIAGEILWAGDPLARSILGVPKTVDSIRRDQLKRYLEKHYVGTNMAVAFIGPVDHEEMVALCQQALGDLPEGEATTAPIPGPMAPGPHWRSGEEKTSQYSLTIYFPTMGFGKANYLPLPALRRLLDDGFSSRLQATVREKQGLVYDVSAAYIAYSDVGAFSLDATVSPDRLQEVFIELQRHLGLLCSEPPSDEEWTRTLTRWRASLASALDRPAQLVDRYVSDRLFQVDEPLSLMWDRIEKINPAQLPEVAQQHLRPEKMVTVLVGPKASKKLKQLKSNLFDWTVPGATPPL